MRAAGLIDCYRRRRGLTRRDPQTAPAPDLVNRQFMAAAPDLTKCGPRTSPTSRPGQAGCYLAVVLDIFSRRVMDWAMADHNPRRRHSTLGQLSPADFERSHQAQHAAAQP
jgi:putative transposase